MQFRNYLAQGKNSFFAQQSENSYFAQDSELRDSEFGVYSTTNMLNSYFNTCSHRFFLYMCYLLYTAAYLLTRNTMLWNITKARLFKYIVNFITQKWKISDEKILVLLYFCSKT